MPPRRADADADADAEAATPAASDDDKYARKRRTPPRFGLWTLAGAAAGALLLGALLLSAAAQTRVAAAAQIGALKLSLGDSSAHAVDAVAAKPAESVSANHDEKGDEKEKEEYDDESALDDFTAVAPPIPPVLTAPKENIVKANLPAGFLLLPPISTRALKPRAVITSLLASFDDSLMNRHLLMAVEMQTFLFIHSKPSPQPANATISTNDIEFVVIMNALTPSFVRQKMLLLGARILIVPPLTKLGKTPTPDARYTLLQMWKLEKVYESILYIDPSLVFMGQDKNSNTPLQTAAKLWRLLDHKEGMQQDSAFYNPEMDFMAAVLKRVGPSGAAIDEELDNIMRRRENPEKPKPSAVVPWQPKSEEDSVKEISTNLKAYPGGTRKPYVFKKRELVAQSGLMLFKPKKALFEKLVAEALKNVDETNELPDGFLLESLVIGKLYLSQMPTSFTRIPRYYNMDPASPKTEMEKIVGYRQSFWGVGSDLEPPIKFDVYAKKFQELRVYELGLYSKDPKAGASLPITPPVPNNFETWTAVLQSPIWHQKIALISANNTSDAEVKRRVQVSQVLTQADHSMTKVTGVLKELEVVGNALKTFEWVWFMDSAVKVGDAATIPLLHVEVGRIARAFEKRIILVKDCYAAGKALVLLKHDIRDKLQLFIQDMIDRFAFSGAAVTWKEVIDEMQLLFEVETLVMEKTSVATCV